LTTSSKSPRPPPPPCAAWPTTEACPFRPEDPTQPRVRNIEQHRRRPVLQLKRNSNFSLKQSAGQVGGVAKVGRCYVIDYLLDYESPSARAVARLVDAKISFCSLHRSAFHIRHRARF